MLPTTSWYSRPTAETVKRGDKNGTESNGYLPADIRWPTAGMRAETTGPQGRAWDSHPYLYPRSSKLSMDKWDHHLHQKVHTQVNGQVQQGNSYWKAHVRW